VPCLCEVYPGICLTTEEKARKNISQGSRRMPVGKDYASWKNATDLRLSSLHTGPVLPNPLQFITHESFFHYKSDVMFSFLFLNLTFFFFHHFFSVFVCMCLCGSVPPFRFLNNYTYNLLQNLPLKSCHWTTPQIRKF